MSAILEIVKMIAGSTGGSFAIVAGAVWLAFWIHEKIVRMLARHDEIGRNHDKIENGMTSLRGDMVAVHGEIATIRGDVQYLRRTLNMLVNNEQGHQQKEASMQSHSPLSLTDFGRKMAAGLNAEHAIALNWETIKAKMDAEIPSRNPYDIQTYCLEKIPVAPEDFFDNESINRFKLYAFSIGRTLFECLRVVGLVIRDEYFKSAGIALAALDAPPAPTQPAAGAGAPEE